MQMLKQKIQEIENQGIVVTDQIQFRILQSLTSGLETLSVMLDYVKETPLCTPCQDPKKRVYPEIITMKTNNEDQLLSSVIAIDHCNTNAVKELLDQKNITCTIVKPKDLKTLMRVPKEEQNQKIREYFNQFQVYVLPSTILVALKRLLDTKLQYKIHHNEVETIHQIYKELKNLQMGEIVDPHVFTDQLRVLVDQLPEFIDQAQNVEKLHVFGGQRTCEQQGLHFQRVIYLQSHSSKCRSLIPSKCYWLLNYKPKSFIPVQEIGRSYNRMKSFQFHQSSNLKKYYKIDIVQEQLNQYLTSIMDRIVLPEQDFPFFRQVSHVIDYEISDSIPEKGVQNLTQLPQLIHQLPFKKYDLKQEDSITQAVQAFHPENVKQKALESIIKQKHNEDCPICLLNSTERFTFGCCGCSISLECFNNLIMNGFIKCPTCRYKITQLNTVFGVFFLDTLFNLNPAVTIDKYTNTTILIQDCLMKRAKFNQDDQVHNIIIKLVNYKLMISSILELYNEIKETPSHLKIKIFLNGTQSLIDHIKQKLMIPII